MADCDNQVLESAREKLKKVQNLRNVDGVNHVWYDPFKAPDFENVFQRIRDTVFSSTDIISLGFPRSGNHWVFEILHMVTHQKVEFSNALMFGHAFESMGTIIESPKSTNGHPKIYTGHLTLDRLSEDFLEKNVKVVYILRNPKDAIISSYYLMSEYRDDRVRLNMSWDEFFELELTGEVPWGGWFDHILKTEAFMKEHPTCPIFVLQFEKLKENPEKAISELCQFLGQPETLAAEIAEATKFKSMKEGTKMMEMLQAAFFRNGWEFLPKGKVNTWKSHFTVPQNERFDKMFDNKLKDSKLGAMVREYIK